MSREGQIAELLSVWDASPVKPELEELCRACPELLEPLRKRIRALEEAERLLDTDRLLKGDGLADPLTAPARGRQDGGDPMYVGQYRILGRIGEGGMGVVYRAEQREPVRRLVALKLIKLGMDSREVVARFEAERQALALMNHPNVANVLDAGITDAGRPYFAMELVQGVDFVRYCEDEKLGIRQRLELFIPVCQAVQHAHQKGIIHRDLKPSNILVQLIDGKAVAKVIDFGIAKATNQQLTQQTLFTQTGAMIGTPEYMSPEQAITSGLDVDTRTDIYSLGVILYQLLTGTLPIEPKALRAAGLEGMARLIKNTEPQRPSVRLLKQSTPASSGSSPGMTRATRLVHRELQEDLDWIVLKAMEKDRGRRYETANALAVDLQRHLDGETVLARPPSTIYRVRKFATRHKLPVAAGSAVLFTLIGAVILVGWAYSKAKAERDSKDAAYQLLDSANKKLDSTNRTLASANNNLEVAKADADRATKAAKEESAKLTAALLRLTDGDILRADALVGAERIEEARNLYQKAIAQAGVTDLSAGQQRSGLRLGFVAEAGLSLAEMRSPPPLLTLRADEKEEKVLGVVFSGDGRYVFSGGWDGYVRRWDLLGGTMAQMDVRPGGMTAVACGGDARTAVAMDASGTVRVCDLENLKETRPTPWGAGGTAMGLSADGRFVLVSLGGRLQVWDLRQGVQIGEAGAKADDVTCCALSPDGQRVLLGTAGNELEAWEVRGTKLMWQIQLGAAAHCVALSRDEGYAIVGVGETGLQILDLARKIVTRALQGHRGIVNCVAFGPDGAMAVSGGMDHSVRLWNWRGGNQICCYQAHSQAVRAVAFSPDGRTVGSGAADGAVIVWPVPRPSGEELEAPEHSSNVTISADGRMALAGCNDNTATVWDLGSGRVLRKLQGAGDRLEMTALSADGKRAVAATGVGVELLVWDLETEKPPRVLQDGLEIESLAMSSDGRRALCGHPDSVTLWDLARGTKVAIKGHAGEVKAVAFSGDGMWALSGSQKLLLHDLRSSSVVTQEVGTNGSVIRSVAISPDGLRALTGDEEGRVRLWDLSSKVIATIGRHTNYVTGVTFGPDGRTAISCSLDRSLKMWDLNSSTEFRVIADGIEALSGIAMTNDRMTLATSGTTELETHRIRTWDLGRSGIRKALMDRLGPAMKKLREGAADGESLGVLGEWYAFEEKYDWAVDVLERARTLGYAVDPVLLGRCYGTLVRNSQGTGRTRMGSMTNALREFRLALGRAKEGPESFYLGMCVSAVERGIQAEKAEGSDVH